MSLGCPRTLVLEKAEFYGNFVKIEATAHYYTKQSNNKSGRREVYVNRIKLGFYAETCQPDVTIYN